MSMQKILIVEDDIDIAELERDYFEAAGFAATIETDGRRGQEAALTGGYDLVVLDLMLPGEDGFAICRALRQQSDIPIVFVSARQTDVDKIRSFGLGADDYLTKPFSPGELVARCQAHLRRYAQLKGHTRQAKQCLKARGLELRKAEHRVFLDGREIVLPHREFDLLAFLMENAGCIFSRDTLFERLWGLDALGNTATVAVHINRIRERLGDNSTQPRFIETVRGAGYRFRKD